MLSTLFYSILSLTLMWTSVVKAEVAREDYKCDEADQLIREKAQRRCDFTLEGAHIITHQSKITRRFGKIADGKVSEYCSIRAFYICMPKTLTKCAEEHYLHGALNNLALKSTIPYERIVALQELGEITRSESCHIGTQAGTSFDRRFRGEPTATAKSIIGNAAR